MKYRRKRLLTIKTKHLKIIVPIIVVILLIVGIVLLTSSQREKSEKNTAVEAIAQRGIFYIGLRGDIGALCTYDDERGVYDGLEKDIADEITTRLFGDDILVQYVDVSSETKDALLKTADIDIALGASVAQETRGITYTAPYYRDGSAFLVMEGSMTREAGLFGGTVGIIYGSYATEEVDEELEITRMAEYLDAQGIDAQVKVLASYPEAMDALEAGIVDGICANEIFLKIFGKSGMLMLPERFMPVPMSVGVSSELGAFADAVNDVLTEMREDGSLDALIEKWNLIDYDILETE